LILSLLHMIFSRIFCPNKIIDLISTKLKVIFFGL
jgi:hypothetical protein